LESWDFLFKIIYLCIYFFWEKKLQFLIIAKKKDIKINIQKKK